MEEKPTIEFPCDDYPIKVIARSSVELTRTVIEIVRLHDSGFQETTVSFNASSKGKYTSVRLAIRATGETQLRALHQDLMSHPLVKLVL